MVRARAQQFTLICTVNSVQEAASMRMPAAGPGVIQTMALAAFVALGAAVGMALIPAKSSAGIT